MIGFSSWTARPTSWAVEHALHDGELVVHDGGHVVHDGEHAAHDGERVVYDGERAVRDGERAVYDGDRAVHDGERAVYDGERAVRDGERAVYDGDRAVHDEERAVYYGERAVYDGERAVYDEERAAYVLYDLVIQPETPLLVWFQGTHIAMYKSFYSLAQIRCPDNIFSGHCMVQWIINTLIILNKWNYVYGEKQVFMESGSSRCSCACVVILSWPEIVLTLCLLVTTIVF